MYCKTTGMTGKTSIYMDAQYCMILVFSGFVLGQACGGLTALTSSDLVSGLALQRLCPDTAWQAWSNTPGPASLWNSVAELILSWEVRSDRTRVSESPLKINEECWWHSCSDRSKISLCLSDPLHFKTLTKAGIFSRAHHLGLIAPSNHKSIKLNYCA